MSFQYRSMQQLESEIVYRFSISGVAARHSVGATGRIRDLFNASWQKLRELVALSSDGSYLVGTAPAALPVVPAVTGETYAEIDWPVDAIGIYGVRVLLTTGGKWYPLKRMPFAAYQDFQYQGLFQSATPRGPSHYTPRLIPTNTTTVETPGKIMLTPVPQGGTYRLWYLQGWAPQLTDTVTFPGHAVFHEWAILDTLLAMLGPDGNARGQAKLWLLQLERAEERIAARASQFESGVALEPRDARGDGYDQEQWNGPY